MTANVEKVALVTGATDGIGKATALQLAQHGYAIHALGRSDARGKRTLAELNAIGSDRAHRLFLVDLGDMTAVHEFLRQYTRNYDTLDLLVLNANIWLGKVGTSADGVDLIFAIGYLSRYLFSIRLNALLACGDGARVVHVGGTGAGRAIDYDKLARPDYGVLKATFQSYAASACLAYFLNLLGITSVPHEILDPGIVNTRQIRERNVVLRVLARLTGLIEPEEAGRRIVRHILDTRAEAVASKFYALEKEKKLPSKLTGDREAFDRLVRYSEQVTGVALTEIHAKVV